MSIIINLRNLAKTSLRKKALQIAEAGYGAIEIEKAVSRKIKFQNGKLFIKSAMTRHSAETCSEFDLSVFKRVSLIGIGKGSALASMALAKILGKKLTGGIALDVNKLQTTNYKLQTLAGTHPLPSQKNVIATQKIIKLARSFKKDDLLITFICGGGSSLMCGSKKELKASQTVFKELTKAGVNIEELNTVRKHLSEVKGGGLAKMAYPATVISLIVSDVLGNNLSMVASGPTVFDKTTKKDAEKILKKYQHKSACLSLLISDLKETPKQKKYFEKVKNVLFLSNREPLLAMAKKARELGFKSKIYSLKLHGEAKNALLLLSSALPYREVPKAILAGGETTVALEGRPRGKGGRNMEAVLGALNFLNSKSYILNSDLVVMSFASDGRDNTEAAGAIGDNLTLQKAKKLKLNPKEFLDMNDSFDFFKKTGDLIYTEQKTFNVADLMIALRE